MPDLVFGYGSLAALPGAVPCALRGHRRTWGVAMDNTVTIPGYKVYRDGSGAQPGVCVAFLDVEPVPGERTTGAVVAAGDLRALDRRERNYERIEVTELMDGCPDGRVWAYAGLEESRARARRAREAGTLVVVRDYLDMVETALGAEVPVPEDLPVRELRHVDVPEPTDDGRYLRIAGRRWRATDPSLPDEERRRLVSELMAARSAVGHAKRRGDGPGERGPRWWEREA